MSWSETLQKAVTNLASTKLVLGVVGIIMVTQQFANSSGTIQDWAIYVAGIVTIATGHNVLRMIEKKNGKKGGD